MSLSLKYLRPLEECRNLVIAKRVARKYMDDRFKPIPREERNSLQKGYLNFYGSKITSPYIPLAASGPWIITNENTIVYDVGGYGMLGFGHNDKNALCIMSKPQTMANIMTPSYSQQKFYDLFQKETNYKYSKIVCLNSGSEANTFAYRIANAHKKLNPVVVCLEDSFHGRTEAPSLLSNSCMSVYRKYLWDYKNHKMSTNLYNKSIYTVKPNSIKSLEDTFRKIKERKEYPELTIFEPVMGEGKPGLSITPDFYKRMRELTKKSGGILLADSVQSGFRCKGELSITNYPNFTELDPPDMESFSKALNGGQYPFSVVAMNDKSVHNYREGLYGNTMSSNPRALDLAANIIEKMTPRVKKNIVDQGNYFYMMLCNLCKKHEIIKDVGGTGLLLSLFLDKKKIKNLDAEMGLRLRGLNVIHGGSNSLRFTPWFLISRIEIDMIGSLMDDYFSSL